MRVITSATSGVRLTEPIRSRSLWSVSRMSDKAYQDPMIGVDYPTGQAGARRHRIALLPGDGVGKEVVAEARKAIDALGVFVDWTELSWGCDYYAAHGSMMAAGWLETIRAQEAVLMGACGWPTVPDHVSLWGMTLRIRQSIDLWANIRPARLLPGVPTPL